ncbi:MAG TPA: sigma-70 family RNA polymerase sigma factor [Thermoleophilaceae bacterium]|jgi:RNA polymerase sigma factor (sigma-70 family)
MPPTDTTDTLRELRPRPSREQIDPVAAELMRRHGAEVMASAQHWADTPEDAEDAYQRGMEIMLKKAPSTDPEHLVPWLKTVVKREAWAIRRQRERHTPPVGEHDELDSPGPLSAHDHAERLDRLRRGAEALSWLKPNEVRALVLKAEGLSYQEICDETGWTYTKVNRMLSEGRQRFQDRLAGIESGAECRRLGPLLSRLADGEALAEDMALLRPHLRTCLTCRARLRDYRTAPAKVAAIAPPIAVGGAPVAAAGAVAGWLRDALQAGSGWVSERSAGLAIRWQQAVELATAHKAAAVVASAAVLGGGGIATVSSVGGGAKPRAVAPARPATAPPAAGAVAAAERRPGDEDEGRARAVPHEERPAGATRTGDSSAERPAGRGEPSAGEAEPNAAGAEPSAGAGKADPRGGEFTPDPAREADPAAPAAPARGAPAPPAPRKDSGSGEFAP